MKMKSIREMTGEELDKQLADLRQEKLNLHIQAKTGQLEKPARITQIRKDIARILTERNSRASKAAAEAAKA